MSITTAAGATYGNLAKDVLCLWHFGCHIPFLPILRLEASSIKILYGHTPFLAC